MICGTSLPLMTQAQHSQLQAWQVFPCSLAVWHSSFRRSSPESSPKCRLQELEQGRTRGSFFDGSVDLGGTGTGGRLAMETAQAQARAEALSGRLRAQVGLAALLQSISEVHMLDKFEDFEQQQLHTVCMLLDLKPDVMRLTSTEWVAGVVALPVMACRQLPVCCAAPANKPVAGSCQDRMLRVSRLTLSALSSAGTSSFAQSQAIPACHEVDRVCTAGDGTAGVAEQASTLPQPLMGDNDAPLTALHTPSHHDPHTQGLAPP